MRKRHSDSAAGGAAEVPIDDLEALAKQWVMDGKLRSLSPKTLDERQNILAKLAWLAGREGWTTIGPAEVTEFLVHVRTGHSEPGGRWGGVGRDVRLGHPPSDATILAYHRTIRGFANWLADQGYVTGPLLRHRKPPRSAQSEIQPFEEAQLQALISAAKNSPNPQRDVAILLVLLDTGIRAAELCALS